ncbi:MAG: ABC transporter permease [Lachnospiraceae bacterium]|nr:ABC transporter permease [Lachnospiraceae bacterium]
MIIKCFLCACIVILAVIAIIKAEKLFTVPLEFYRNRKIVWNLAKNDFKTKYAGSYLGIFWAFVQPLVTTAVYWFVFQVGLKSGQVSDFPFVLWLMSGLVPWFFFQEGIMGGTNALLEYNYLVKKVVFDIDILPIVKVCSAFFVHLFFIMFIMALCACYGYFPNVYTLQVVYLLICNFVLVLGLSYLTSAMVGFARDLTQIINIVLQIGMWITPIMWNVSILQSPILKFLMKLNPMYYIVEGFRAALLAKEWIIGNVFWTVYFWIVTLGIWMLGVLVFKKLKIHFADVL